MLRPGDEAGATSVIVFWCPRGLIVVALGTECRKKGDKEAAPRFTTRSWTDLSVAGVRKWRRRADGGYAEVADVFGRQRHGLTSR